MKCIVCKIEITGRSDKKFCSVECKNYYHVNLRRVTDVAVRSINKILHRNRSILLEILGKRKTQIKVKRLVLDQKKFNFKYHTHIIRNSRGKLFFYVYDLAWMEFSDNEVLIVKRR